MPVVYILLAILVLLLMIVIHEFGHYIAGKILKFKIAEFSVGFGPAIFSKKNKKTDEKFSIRVIPLGGYCAFEGENELDDKRRAEELNKEHENIDVFNSDVNETTIKEEIAPRPQSELKKFDEQPPWKRIIVLVAGALFNFVSAILFSILFLAVVGVARPVVLERYEDDYGVAYNQQIEVGDVIYAVNGEDVTPLQSYGEIMENIEGDTFVLTVLRKGELIDVTVMRKEIVHEGESYLGIGMTTQSSYYKMSLLDSLKYCVPYTLKLSWSILGTFGQLITGQIPLNSMSGPVSTVSFMAELASYDINNILILLPLIASNLAIFNLLPIPALDGSKILFTIIEWIRKKPMNKTVEAYVHLAGMVLLIGFVCLVEILHFVG